MNLRQNPIAFNNYSIDVDPSISLNTSYVNGSIYDYLNTKYDKSMFLVSVTESEIVLPKSYQYTSQVIEI